MFVSSQLTEEAPSCGCEGCQGEDGTLPLCFMSGLNSGPPTTLEVTAQDFESGILSIEVLTLVNSKIEIPKGSGAFYEQGDVVTLPLEQRDGTKLIRAEKIDQQLRSQVVLNVTNGAGLVRTCDPVISLTARQAGPPERVSYDGIPESEGQITIHNGRPGLRQLEVRVNGRKFGPITLADGERLTLDTSSAMLPGDSNVVTLTAHGKPGGAATVVIHD
jgi:hypothetical protein